MGSIHRYPLLSLVVSLLVTAGCGAGGSAGEGEELSAAIQASRPPDAPGRVVSLAPNLTEMIYRIGAEDRLVGVTNYCRYPSEAQSKPKVGALVNMNYERLLELDPDHVVLLPAHEQVEKEINRLGIATTAIRSESIEDIYRGLDTLGRLLDRKGESKRAIEELKALLARYKPADGAADRPRVLFVIGRNPGTLQQIYACGSGNFLNEMIEAVGAVNVLSGAVMPWPVIKKEAIVQMDPDVILDGSIFEGEVPAEGHPHMEAWKQLETLKALRTGRIVAIYDDHLLIPGPGALEQVDQMARMIHGRDGNDAE